MAEMKRDPEPRRRDIDPGEYIELIRTRAHELYLARGGQDGHDLDDWLEAERLVRKALGLDD